MKKLSEMFEKIIEQKKRKYHLSYDTIDTDRHFDNYAEARRYLLCVLTNVPNISLESCNNSSIILECNENDFYKLTQYLKVHLANYFYYSFSLVAKNKRFDDLIENNLNHELNKNFKKELADLTCECLNKNIVNY